jgi:hypothetical protein
MPRIRPRAYPLELDLNVPAYRLDAYEAGVRTRRYTVAIGMRKYKTPRGQFEVTSVEWNPWWIPPRREWARKEHVTPPGWSNPMGRVKLNFHPLYFLHGTPFEESRGHAASHGCVRMSNADAVELARYVHSLGTPDLDAVLFDSLVADTSLTRIIQLAIPVPIRIRYDVAEVADDTLFLYRDVYAIDRRSDAQRALDALRDAGIAIERVDQGQLRKSLRSGSRPAKIPIHDFLTGERHPAGARGRLPYSIGERGRLTGIGTRAMLATRQRHTALTGGSYASRPRHHDPERRHDRG